MRPRASAGRRAGGGQRSCSSTGGEDPAARSGVRDGVIGQQIGQRRSLHGSCQIGCAPVARGAPQDVAIARSLCPRGDEADGRFFLEKKS